MFLRWFSKNRYSRLPSNEQPRKSGCEAYLDHDGLGCFQMGVVEGRCYVQIPLCILVSMFVTLALVAGLVGLGVGAIVFRKQNAQLQTVWTAPEGITPIN